MSLPLSSLSPSSLLPLSSLSPPSLILYCHSFFPLVSLHFSLPLSLSIYLSPSFYPSLLLYLPLFFFLPFSPVVSPSLFLSTLLSCCISLSPSLYPALLLSSLLSLSIHLSLANSLLLSPPPFTTQLFPLASTLFLPFSPLPPSFLT